MTIEKAEDDSGINNHYDCLDIAGISYAVTCSVGIVLLSSA